MPSRLFAHLPLVIRQIARLYYLGNLRFHFDLHESVWNGRARGRCPVRPVRLPS